MFAGIDIAGQSVRGLGKSRSGLTGLPLRSRTGRQSGSQALHIDHLASPAVAVASKRTRLRKPVGNALSCAGGVFDKALQYILKCCAWAKRHPFKAIAFLMGFTVAMTGLVFGCCAIPECGLKALIPVSTASCFLLTLALQASSVLNPTQLQFSKLEDDLKDARLQISRGEMNQEIERKARQAQDERLEVIISQEVARAESRLIRRMSDEAAQQPPRARLEAFEAEFQKFKQDQQAESAKWRQENQNLRATLERRDAELAEEKRRVGPLPPANASSSAPSYLRLYGPHL